jgi:tetratricopeptide (TPR) repeat protein
MRLGMPCVSDAEVLGLLAGALDPAQRRAVERHLDECAECLEVVTLASKTSLAAGSQRPSPGDAASATAPTEPGDLGTPRAAGAAGAGAAGVALAAGASLGRYEILEVLGRGGMGMVYAARDVQLGRRVAIKVVAPDLAEDARSQLALLREAQALARITQPNVLTVYDVGSAGDAVFLAAELVDGETLDRWLATPRRWRAVVDVFVQAARGLDAVHAAGLVHRDFKPANVLVGHDGRVRVFDFGVVRFADHTSSERELAGTPIYMAPEQRRGEVADARADQYAFCVALHEAVWGTLPADRAAEAPPRTPTVDGAPGWLRAVVDRGLARAPGDRFPSMRALIDALERGLGRRRRALRIGLGALAVTAAATTAGLGYLMSDRDDPLARCSALPGGTLDPARRAAIAPAFAATGLPYAATSAAEVEQGIDRFVLDWRGQRREACVAFEADRAANRDMHDRRVACLDQHWMIFEAVLDRFTHADAGVVNRAPQLIGSVPDPEACRLPPVATAPTDPATRERLATHLKEAAAVWALAESGQVAEAAPRAEALVRDAATLGSPVAQADAMYLAGHITGAMGRWSDAVTQVDAALWAAEAARHDALVVTAAGELIWMIASRQRRPDDARKYAALIRAAAERVGSVAARVKAARSIGTIEMVAGKFEPAVAEYTRARALADEVGDPLLIATLEMDLANIDQRRGHPVAAIERLRGALAIFDRELGRGHPRRVGVLNNLGNALLDLGQQEEGAAMFVEALATQEGAFGADHLDTAQVRGNVSSVYIAAGDLAAARKVLEQNVAIYEAKDPTNPLYASTLNNLAEVDRLEGKLADAEAHYRRSLEIRRARYGEHHLDVTQSLLSLGGIAVLRGDLRGAAARCEEAAASIAGSDAGHKAYLATVETCRGEVALHMGKRARAVAFLEHALELHGTEDAGRLGDTQYALARALPASERKRAIELAKAARAGFVTQAGYRTKDIAEIDKWLAAAERGGTR